jgi:hypothetical protein
MVQSLTHSNAAVLTFDTVICVNLRENECKLHWNSLHCFWNFSLDLKLFPNKRQLNNFKILYERTRFPFKQDESTGIRFGSHMKQSCPTAPFQDLKLW